MVNKVSPPHRLTADKREIKDFPKLPSATSFIRKPLYEIRLGGFNKEFKRWGKIL